MNHYDRYGRPLPWPPLRAYERAAQTLEPNIPIRRGQPLISRATLRKGRAASGLKRRHKVIEWLVAAEHRYRATQALNNLPGMMAETFKALETDGSVAEALRDIRKRLQGDIYDIYDEMGPFTLENLLGLLATAKTSPSPV